jgi:hypothetical protein
MITPTSYLDFAQALKPPIRRVTSRVKSNEIKWFSSIKHNPNFSLIFMQNSGAKKLLFIFRRAFLPESFSKNGS